MHTTTVYRTLPVKLTDADVAKRADELAAKELQKEQVESEKKNAVAGLNGRINLLKESIAKLSRAVDKKVEDQDVPCDEIWDDDRFELRVVRKDTKEVIAERPFDAVEREEALIRKQETLPFEPDPVESKPKNKAGKGKGKKS